MHGLPDPARIRKRGKAMPMLKKRGSVLLLIALFVGAAYLAYSASYWTGANTSGTDTDRLGAGIATVLVMPHLVLTILAVVFNALGLFMYSRPFTLVAAILYSVAMVLFPVYFMFVVAEAVFCYIAFARMPKAGQENQTAQDPPKPQEESDSET